MITPDAMPNRIRELRQHSGLSLQAVADLIHVSKMTVSQLERGSITLSLEYMRRIAKVFDVIAVDLLSLDDQDEFVGREEMQLVRAYRAADPTQREIITRVAAPLLRAAEAAHTGKDGSAK